MTEHTSNARFHASLLLQERNAEYVARFCGGRGGADGILVADIRAELNEATSKTTRQFQTQV